MTSLNYLIKDRHGVSYEVTAKAVESIGCLESTVTGICAIRLNSTGFFERSFLLDRMMAQEAWDTAEAVLYAELRYNFPTMEIKICQTN